MMSHGHILVYCLGSLCVFGNLCITIATQITLHGAFSFWTRLNAYAELQLLDGMHI